MARIKGRICSGRNTSYVLLPLSLQIDRVLREPKDKHKHKDKHHRSATKNNRSNFKIATLCLSAASYGEDKQQRRD
jgi:hypothetical protein